jgi:DNA-binding NtrC family response regulator
MGGGARLLRPHFAWSSPMSECRAWAHQASVDARIRQTPVIVLTAYGSVETAVEAINRRENTDKASQKPEELRIVVDRVLRSRAMPDRACCAAEAGPPTRPMSSRGSMKQVSDGGSVARNPTPSSADRRIGNRKEVVARFIHRRSPRRIARLSRSTVQRSKRARVELFATKRDLSPSRRPPGHFELADEARCSWTGCEMDVNLQAKLDSSEQQFQRIGGDRNVTVDVRVIATTNKDLTAASR